MAAQNDEIIFERYNYTEGQIYEGEWCEKGKKHGLGNLKFADGEKYSGRFKDGLFNGLGVLTLEEGTVYEGDFYNGRFHGFGVYTRGDGMTFTGRFSDGSPKGPGRVTFPDGFPGDPIQEGFFEGARLVRRYEVGEEITTAKVSAEKARQLVQDFA